tara:strand:- start:3138 stop:3386 length:249 start_codon:yes stop_codon:yes gene_type:complete
MFISKRSPVASISNSSRLGLKEKGVKNKRTIMKRAKEGVIISSVGKIFRSILKGRGAGGVFLGGIELFVLIISKYFVLGRFS